MNIEQVMTFLDLVDTKSFNATAERLGLTQSTVSSRVQSLETDLGKRLFSRSRAGTSLTTAGTRFVHHALAMQQEWNEAQRSVQTADNFSQSLRIGLQSDIATSSIGDWVVAFRAAMPDTSFYIEADYSIQMSADLLAGDLDIGVMFAPRHFPDLHNERVGDISYSMVSTDTDDVKQIDPQKYIHANYTPAFNQAHRRLHPALTRAAPVACGHSIAVCSLLRALGGSAYVMREYAETMVAQGVCRFVKEVEPIVQSVYMTVQIRHRHTRVTQQITQIVRNQFARS